MGWGCICSLAQLTSHSRWGTPRVGHQSIRFLKQRQATFEAHTDAYRLFRIIIINHVFGDMLGEEARAPGDNSQRVAVEGSSWTTGPLCYPVCVCIFICIYIHPLIVKKKNCFKNLGFSYSNKLFFVRDHKWIQQMLILLRKNGKSKEFNVFIV